MGIKQMGPPLSFMVTLQQKFNIKYFVETKTFKGNTAFWASKHFETVFTIENSEKIYKRTKSKFLGVENISFLFGNSRNKLVDVIDQVSDSAIIWLDSHWSGGETYGANDQCPLLEELEIINNSHLRHFIFIDDARLFESPPPPPHDLKYWPDLVSVINKLQSIPDSFVVILEDVIICVPNFSRDELVKYCRDVNEVVWKNSSKFSITKGVKMIVMGMPQDIKKVLKKIVRRK